MTYPSRDWMRFAACVGHDRDMWFSQKNDSNLQQAKAICATCTVQDTCLAYAIAHEIEWGVWGGKSERQRAVMTGKRKVGPS